MQDTVSIQRAIKVPRLVRLILLVSYAVTSCRYADTHARRKIKVTYGHMTFVKKRDATEIYILHAKHIFWWKKVMCRYRCWCFVECGLRTRWSLNKNSCSAVEICISRCFNQRNAWAINVFTAHLNGSKWKNMLCDETAAAISI